MQHSIFEPLYCLNPPIMEAPKLSLTSPSPSLFTISPPSPSSSSLAINTEHPPFCFDQDISCSLHAHIITPSSTSTYKKTRSEQDFTSDSTHVNLPLSHSTLSATTPSPCSINGNSSLSKFPPSPSITRRASGSVCDADDRNCDDGSVASKLFSSITKSISSPSLQLKSCKEAARETPYQKTLKLKHMKLQHCAEALGMESSDNSSILYDHQEKIDMIGNPSSFPPSFTSPNSHQESSLKSVKSSPNLSNASPFMASHSRYTRSTSFPPPLSHTLPASSSYDSLSISLCAYRENGRFILKEIMVPSKRYFQASRRNGRLTLHVFTREEEAEEDFAGQADDHEEFSYRKCQKENLSEVEEEEIPMCMVSLYKETPGKSFDNKVEESDNTNESLNEEVCVKKSLGMHNSKEINVAASHLDMSLQTLNCIANHNNNNDSEDEDKRNVISNIITLSLQTSGHSKVTLHKAQVLSFPPVSSSLKQSAFIHCTGRNHGFLSSTHDMSTFPQSKKEFVWETSLMPCAVATSGSRRIQRKGGGGCGGGAAAAAPAFVMEEIRQKSLLMKAVSELATSLILESSYASGDWGLAGEKKPLLSEEEGYGESGTIIGGYASDIDSAIDNDGLISYIANFGYNTSYSSEDSNTISEGGKELEMTTSPLNLDLQFSSSNATLQYEEWLHTLHCKELFDRHHLGQGLMKPHCIPTRS